MEQCIGNLLSWARRQVRGYPWRDPAAREDAAGGFRSESWAEASPRPAPPVVSYYRQTMDPAIVTFSLAAALKVAGNIRHAI